MRENNEDRYLVREGRSTTLIAVADGVGGEAGGEMASAAAIDALAAGFFGASPGQAPADALAAAIRGANDAVLGAAGESGQKGAASTLVAAAIDGTSAVIGNLGDSRAYLLRDGTFTQLSRDHTQVQEMVERGLMEASQVAGHPLGHILSRAVGVRGEIEVDRAEGEVRPGDVFLLCSDGLHSYVAQGEIRRLLGRGSPERALEELIEATLAAGAPDNVTAIAVWASDPTLLSFSEPVP